MLSPLRNVIPKTLGARYDYRALFSGLQSLTFDRSPFHQTTLAAPSARKSRTQHSHARSLATDLARGPDREEMTPLASFLTRQIMFSGPMPVSQYMHLCLTHPEHGYYTTRKSVIGPDGDFVTAPEVSQVFGEMVAVWVAHVCSQMDVKYGFSLAELGPGRGTLMADILRSLARIGCLPREVHFVEASTIMRNAQKEAVGSLSAEYRIDIVWHDSMQNIPDRGLSEADPNALPVLYIAQEFFDALPVHMFQSTPEGKWRERFVDVVRDDDVHSAQSPYRFRFVLSPGYSPATAVYAPRYLPEIKPTPTSDPDIAIVELCPDGIAVVEQLADRVSKSGAAALVVDYGTNENIPGYNRLPSLRAIRDHTVVDVRSKPGMCDITADVNYAHIRRAVEESNAVYHGSTTQREFLLRLGAAGRFRSLAMSVIDSQTLTSDEKDKKLERLEMDYDRLISPMQMGNSYRVCGITHKSLKPIALKP